VASFDMTTSPSMPRISGSCIASLNSPSADARPVAFSEVV
jgi:hypothetical protein